MVTEGIKHARVGLDSHEFKELEMSLLVAGDILPPEARPSTSSMMMPMTAGGWLRVSLQGGLGAAGAGGTGSLLRRSMSRSSPLGNTSDDAGARVCVAVPLQLQQDVRHDEACKF